MYLIYSIIYLFLIHVSIENIFIEDSSNELQSFIHKVKNEFMNDSTLITIYNKSSIYEYLNLFTIKNTIIYPNQNKDVFHNLTKYNSYIIISNNTENVIHFLYALNINLMYNNKAKYLFVFDNTINIENVFEITWKYNILNINILLTSKKNLTIYTHFPYTNKICGTNYQPVSINWKQQKLYPEKIPWNLYGCPIKLMGLNIKPYVIDITKDKTNPKTSGLEVTIIHTILQRLNITDIYIKNPFTHWGYLLQDGNFTMSFKSLYEKKVDVIFGMFIGNETIEKYFDVSVTHIDTAAVWFVPTAQQIAQWKNLTVIFDGIVWFSIFFVFVLNGVAWYLLGRNREKGESYNELSLCLMGAFYILLQGSFSTPKAWKIRFVVIIWSVSSLLIFTAHQCQLTGILTSPLYDHQISNTKELVESDLQYGFYPILKNLFSDPNNAVHKKIYNNFKQCSLSTKCMNRTAFKRDFAVVKNKRQGEYLIPLMYSKNGKPMLYTFKESEFLAWCKFYVSKGFPFLEKIDKLILLLQSNGLISKWERDLASGTPGEDDSPQLEALSLNHLQGAFFLLLFGYLLAFFMAIGEKLYFKYKNK